MDVKNLYSAPQAAIYLGLNDREGFHYWKKKLGLKEIAIVGRIKLYTLAEINKIKKAMGK